MQFKVPQFLEIEDKIFGPFTFREFVYLAGGAGLCFTIYKIIGLLWGAIPILIIGGFAALLTFYKPNDKPFINMLEAGFKYFTQDKLYIWKKDLEKGATAKRQAVNADTEKIKAMAQSGGKLSGSKLRDLAWSLDVLDLSKNQERPN